jgi:hypothetical protein
MEFEVRLKELESDNQKLHRGNQELQLRSERSTRHRSPSPPHRARAKARSPRRTIPTLSSGNTERRPRSSSPGPDEPYYPHDDDYWPDGNDYYEDEEEEEEEEVGGCPDEEDYYDDYPDLEEADGEVRTAGSARIFSVEEEAILQRALREKEAIIQELRRRHAADIIVPEPTILSTGNTVPLPADPILSAGNTAHTSPFWTPQLNEAKDSKVPQWPNPEKFRQWWEEFVEMAMSAWPEPKKVFRMMEEIEKATCVEDLEAEENLDSLWQKMREGLLGIIKGQFA